MNLDVEQVLDRVDPAVGVRRRLVLGRLHGRPAAEQGGNGGAIRFIPATAAQQRAVHAICRELGIEVSAVLAENGVAGMERLGLRQASQIIDKLKSRKGR